MIKKMNLAAVQKFILFIQKLNHMFTRQGLAEDLRLIIEP